MLVLLLVISAHNCRMATKKKLISVKKTYFIIDLILLLISNVITLIFYLYTNEISVGFNSQLSSIQGYMYPVSAITNGGAKS